MKYILAILAVVILSSCEDFFETTLELETPEFESQLVLSAVLNSNETDRRILLTETVSLNDDARDGYINDATIQLQYPDGDTFLFENIDFSDPFISYNYWADCPEFDQEGTYTMTASDNKGRVATGKVELPPSVLVISATYVADGGKDEFGDDVSAIDILIDDPAGEENFYKLGLWGNNPNSQGTISIESNDPSTSESRNYLNLIVSDTQFDGQQYRLRILFNQNEGSNNSSFLLQFSSISKDQYRFDKILESASENAENPFTTPVQLHTNIDGGIGLFAIERVQEIFVPK